MAMISVSAMPYARAMSSRFASTSSTSKPESISASPADVSSTSTSVAGSVALRGGACLRLRDLSLALPGEAQQHKTHQDQDGEGDQDRAERNSSGRAGRWRRRSLGRRALGLSGRGSRAGARCRGLRGRGRRCSGRGEGFSCRCSRRRRRGECRGWCRLAWGFRRSGVGLRSSGVGEAEAVAVEVGVGMAVGGCATETAAPTTVSSAAAAQMIWARRRKLATMRRRSATMERTIGRGRWRRITTLANGRAGLPPGPTEPAAESSPRRRSQ